MSDKEKKILDTIGGVLPQLTEIEKERLLAFGEGMAYIKQQDKPAEHTV